jgi:hypothetical protein
MQAGDRARLCTSSASAPALLEDAAASDLPIRGEGADQGDWRRLRSRDGTSGCKARPHRLPMRDSSPHPPARHIPRTSESRTARLALGLTSVPLLDAPPLESNSSTRSPISEPARSFAQQTLPRFGAAARMAMPRVKDSRSCPTSRQRTNSFAAGTKARCQSRERRDSNPH